MQRDNRALIHRQMGSAAQQVEPRRIIHRGQRLAQQRVHRGVAEMAPVEQAAAGFRFGAGDDGAERGAAFAGLRAVADQPDAEVAFGAACSVGRHWHGIDGGGDADAAEHLRYRLGDLVVIDEAIIRRVHGEREAVRVARLGQQLLRRLEVVGRDFQGRVVTEQRVGHQIIGGIAQARHHPAADRLAVDRHRQRAPHPDVRQRVLGELLAVLGGYERGVITPGINKQINQPAGDFLPEHQLRIGLDGIKVGRRHALDAIDIARQQAGEAGGIVGDEAQRCIVPRCARAVIGIVTGKLDFLVARIGHEFVRPGADHALAGGKSFGRHAVGGFPAQHENRAEVGNQQRIGRRRGQSYGLGIDHRLAGDGAGENHIAGGRIDQARRAVQRINHVIGGKFRAVGEFRPGPQLEFPGQIINRVPRNGQARADPAVAIHLHQPLEHIGRHIGVGA